MGTRTRARVARDIWSYPRALGAGPELFGSVVDTAGPRTRTRVTGTVCQTRRPLDTVANRLGQLVNIAGRLTQARVARESWSNPRDL